MLTLQNMMMSLKKLPDRVFVRWALPTIFHYYLVDVVISLPPLQNGGRLMPMRLNKTRLQSSSPKRMMRASFNRGLAWIVVW